MSAARRSTAIAVLSVALGTALGAQGKPGLQASDLANFTYDLGDGASVDGGKVPLQRGAWTDPAAGGSRFALDRHQALGDLDGDGAGDAVGIVVEQPADPEPSSICSPCSAATGSRCRPARPTGSATAVSSTA